MQTEYRFSSFAYEFAALIEAGAAEGALGEVDWNNQVVTNLDRFSRVSILRLVAFAFLSTEIPRWMRKSPDSWLESDMLVRLEGDIAFYKITIPSFLSYCRKLGIKKNSNDELDSLRSWLDDHWSEFSLIFSRYSEEMEHLLFGNRHFLLSFHKTVSAFLHENQADISGLVLPIKRHYIPRWVKKAVFYRDRGRCVFCNSDLSGVLDLSNEHFDHIVSLRAGGINDVTNIQLACAPCNLKKSRKSYSRYHYARWWSSKE